MNAAEVRERDGGATFRVRCRPGAPRTRATGEHAGALKLDVAAPPERGKANDEVVRFVAALLDRPSGAVRLLAGASSREKTLFVSGITAAAVSARLAAAIDGSRDSR